MSRRIYSGDEPYPAVEIALLRNHKVSEKIPSAPKKEGIFLPVRVKNPLDGAARSSFLAFINPFLHFIAPQLLRTFVFICNFVVCKYARRPVGSARLNYVLRLMRKFILPALALLLLAGCTEYSRVYKSSDPKVKFEYAKRAFDQKKYNQATTLLESVITPLRGGPDGEEALYLLGLSYYENKDYMNSGVYFKTYYQRYPKGKYAELARFYSGYGYYLDSPDPQLDQSITVKGIEELQGFLDYFPRSDKVTIAQNAIFALQDKLTLKELQNAQLYYNLGNFLGNNYESAVIVCNNALKDYPYSKYREDFELLILKSKYQIARQSVQEKREERYQEVLDEYFSYINNYPDTKNRKEADAIYKIAKSNVDK